MYTIFLGKSRQNCGWSKGVGIGWCRHGGSFVYWKISQLKPLWAQGSHRRNIPSISFPGPQEALCLPLLGNFCQPLSIRHIRLCDPQLVWSRMSSPEKLIKTLHKRKVALHNQHYRVHCHHRHRHHRRQPHHHNHHHHHHHPIRRPCTSADGADSQSLEKPTMNTLSLMTMWDLYQHYFQIDMVQLSHQVSIKSLKHDKHFWELFTSKEEFRVSIIQVGRYLHLDF